MNSMELLRELERVPWWRWRKYNRIAEQHVAALNREAAGRGNPIKLEATWRGY